MTVDYLTSSYMTSPNSDEQPTSPQKPGLAARIRRMVKKKQEDNTPPDLETSTLASQEDTGSLYQMWSSMAKTRIF
ncbi:uncharacterized protein BT62DRAFT_1005380 [Guyanagaster necrorhizus]|uniref:Uncharacterized protein n=1 Tax=Guyanagaster necrorhizus TaxID=856835 RepID=A0A9P7VU39_9AGAR|nr:uncharacterized protein BT62DRAFT_1005380 [Guyanagaster necrorhizus MCA 3950]KAG7446979.1 hypothetical protein BT62DRAFT_1005380 [Guyanagaster necrorhizus MCA 3950]